MITVVVKRIAESKNIASFQVSGHAGYAERGKDIVCAAVSAVTVGTVNAICELTEIRMEVEMRDGFLHASFNEVTNVQSMEQAQLLLESMLVMLKTIQGAYGNLGKFLKIKD